MSAAWTELWSKVMKVEEYGKWGYGVVKLMETELGEWRSDLYGRAAALPPASPRVRALSRSPTAP